MVMDLTYPTGTTDFSDLANQVADTNPDMILGGTTLPGKKGVTGRDR